MCTLWNAHELNAALYISMYWAITSAWETPLFLPCWWSPCAMQRGFCNDWTLSSNRLKTLSYFLFVQCRNFTFSNKLIETAIAAFPFIFLAVQFLLSSSRSSFTVAWTVPISSVACFITSTKCTQFVDFISHSHTPPSHEYSFQYHNEQNGGSSIFQTYKPSKEDSVSMSRPLQLLYWSHENVYG